MTTPRILIAACALAGAVLLHSASASDPKPTAYISEVLWAGSDLSVSDEWVELGLSGSGAIDLTGWTLTSMQSSGTEVVMHTFATGTLLSARTHPVIARFDAARSRLLQDPLVIVPGLTLPNTKLLLRLRDREGGVVDQADDGIGNPMAGSNAAPKASMERISPFAPGDQPESWKTADRSEGFDPDAPMFGTPGAPDPEPPPPPLSPVENLRVAAVQSGSVVTASIAWDAITDLRVAGTTIFDAMSGVVLTVPLTTQNAILLLQASALPAHFFVQNFDSSGGHSEEVKIIVEPLFSSQSSSTNSAQSSANIPTIGSGTKTGSLVISEIGLGVSTGSSWIELANLAQWQSLTGWALKDGATGMTLQLDGEMGTGAYAVFPAGALVKKNGGTVQLLYSGSVVQERLYPLVRTQTSIAFSFTGSGTYQVLCLPTPGGPNDDRWDIEIDIHSGAPHGVGKATLNTQVLPIDDGSVPLSCAVEFGDGDRSQSCNPPSHTYSIPGTYQMQVTAANSCGGNATDTLEIVVLEEPEEPAAQQAAISVPPRSSVASSAASRAGADNAAIVLLRVLPNPSGADSGNERVEIWNSSKQKQTLDGLLLSNDVAKSHMLSGSLAAGERRVFLLPRSVVLKNTSGSLLFGSTRVAWATADEDVWYGAMPSITVVFTDAKDGVQTGRVDSSLVYAKNHQIHFSCDTKSTLIKNKKYELIFGSKISKGDVFTPRECKGKLLSSSGPSTVADGSLSGITISEISPLTSPGQEEWIELWNASASAVALDGMLDDILAGGSKAWTLPGSILGAGEYLVIKSSQSKLQLNDGGDEVNLLDAHGTVMHSVPFGRLPAGTSYARDAAGSWCTTLEPTPGTANSCRAPVLKAKASSSKKATTRTVVRTTAKSASSRSSANATNAILAALMEEEEGREPPASGSSGVSFGWLFLLLLGSLAGGFGGAFAAQRFLPRIHNPISLQRLLAQKVK